MQKAIYKAYLFIIKHGVLEGNGHSPRVKS
jgi:hypothetical protein